MNDDIKKEIEQKANEYCFKEQEGLSVKGGYTAGATEFWDKAIEACIKTVKQHRVNGKILWDIISSLEQLKESINETPTK